VLSACVSWFALSVVNKCKVILNESSAEF